MREPIMVVLLYLFTLFICILLFTKVWSNLYFNHEPYVTMHLLSISLLMYLSISGLIPKRFLLFWFANFLHPLYTSMTYIKENHAFSHFERESLVHLTHTYQTLYWKAHCQNISFTHERRDFQHPYKCLNIDSWSCLIGILKF